MSLFRFSLDQKVINIAGTKIGGQPGEFPTVLCGTIFYQGHKIVEDHDRGFFDEALAGKLVSNQAELSEQTGCPAVLHLYARTMAAFERYLDFADRSWEGPLILDSADPVVRAGMAGLISEVGLADRAIYNSISIGTTEQEAVALEESELDSAIVLAYNPSDSSVDGCMKLLQTGGSVMDKGLTDLCMDLGIVNMLLDPGVMPLGSGAGSALRFSVVAKAKLGWPAGSGIHNAVSAWPWLKGRSTLEKRCCDAAAAAMQQLAGGDFLLYGPIDDADIIFPVAAMADVMIAEAVKDLDIWPVAGHPINRLV